MCVCPVQGVFLPLTHCLNPVPVILIKNMMDGWMDGVVMKYARGNKADHESVFLTASWC